MLTKWGGGREPNGKPFDLAQSLEVAEHLDECYADNFVALLTSLSNIILFSAAIPHQGGTHHINCQPPAYWAKKFAQYDFECYDILRMKFWDNNAIASWYRQNSLIFIHKSKKELFANFTPTQNPAHLMHPNMWESYIKYLEQETQMWHKKYHKILPKRLERLFKSLRAKMMGV